MSFSSSNFLFHITKRRGARLATLAGLTLLGACSGDDPVRPVPGGPSVFDDPALTNACGDLYHEAAVEIVRTNLRALSEALAERTAFLEGASLFDRLLGSEAEGWVSEEELLEDEDALSSWLEERVLHPEQLESSDGASLVYRLRADIYCEAIDGEPDPRCAETLDENAYRVAVSRVACEHGDNVNVELRVGERPLNPLRAQLHRNHLGLEVNLADGFVLLDILNLFDEGVTLDEELGGKLRVVYDVSTEQQATVRVAITEAITLGATAEEGRRIAVRVDPSPEALLLRFDQERERLEGALRFGATELTVPFNFLISTFFGATGVAAESEVASIVLAGFGAELDYAPSDDVLHLSDVHLGPRSSYFRHGSDPLVRIDLNPSAGRKLDLEITSSDDEPFRIAIAPEFHLRLEYSLASVEHLTEDLPAFVTNDLLQIRLSGATPTVVLHEESDGALNWSSQLGRLLQVVSGELTMTSTRFPGENVTVSAQRCLVRDPSGIYEHGFLGPFAAETCEGSLEPLAAPPPRRFDVPRATLQPLSRVGFRSIQDHTSRILRSSGDPLRRSSLKSNEQ